jgi:hypothetical protein
MLSVANKLIMLSVIMVNVAMLSVVMLSVVTLSVVILSVVAPMMVQHSFGNIRLGRKTFCPLMLQHQ